MCDDAETVMIGLGSVTDDAQAVATYLRGQGKKVGVISVKLLQPFPEAEVAAALSGKKAVTVLERCDVTALTSLVTQSAVQGARERRRRSSSRHSADRQAAQDHHRDLRPGRARLAAAPSGRRVQEHGDPQRSVRLSRFAVLRQEPLAARRRVAGKTEGGVSRDRTDGAGDGAEPELCFPSRRSASASIRWAATGRWRRASC